LHMSVHPEGEVVSAAHVDGEIVMILAPEDLRELDRLGCPHQRQKPMFPLHPHDPPRIGPFTLLGRLGEEACTRVYLASARKHGEVALKVVRSTYTAEPAFRTAFAHRVESARELRSPYVA